MKVWLNATREADERRGLRCFDLVSSVRCNAGYAFGYRGARAEECPSRTGARRFMYGDAPHPGFPEDSNHTCSVSLHGKLYAG